MNTPNEVEGYAFNSVSGCNWKKCWSYKRGGSPAPRPYLILLEDDTLWAVPKDSMEGMWGRRPHPRPPTHMFIGPFDTFEEGIATLALMGESATFTL